MPYMICDNCKKTYKIESIHDKPTTCECGEPLRYDKTIKRQNIGQILNESEKIKEKTAGMLVSANGSTVAESEEEGFIDKIMRLFCKK